MCPARLTEALLSICVDNRNRIGRTSEQVCFIVGTASLKLSRLFINCDDEEHEIILEHDRTLCAQPRSLKYFSTRDTVHVLPSICNSNFIDAQADPALSMRRVDRARDLGLIRQRGLFAPAREVLLSCEIPANK